MKDDYQGFAKVGFGESIAEEYEGIGSAREEEWV